ncbi:Protein of unknown function DUF3540 [Rhabdaerophilaceae bacterium]
MVNTVGSRKDIVEQRPFKDVLSADVIVEDFVRGTPRAVSCLVEPQAGDKVLVARVSATAFVLAVLERPGLGDVRLSLPDPMAALSLTAQRIDISAQTTLHLQAPETDVTGQRLTIATTKLVGIADLVVLSGRKFQNFMREQITMAQRLIQHASTRLSVIDGIDHEKAGTKLLTADLSSQQVQTGIIQAKEDMRLDAKRVTVG